MKLPLSADAFLDALARGQGRALMHVRETGSFPSEALMLEQLLESQAYDPQCEGSRAVWLFEMLETLGWTERFAEPVLEAVRTPEGSSWDRSQRCDLALIYAQEGHAGAADALRWVIETRPDPQAPWIGDSQILALEGITGMLRAATSYARGLESGRFESDDLMQLYWDAEERFGAEAIQESLVGKPELEAFADAIAEEVQERAKPRQPFMWEGKTAADVIAEAQTSTKSMIPWFSGWGGSAKPADLERILEVMMSTSDAALARRLWRVFIRKEVPGVVPDALIEQVLACEEERSRYCGLRMLSRKQDPRLRRRALDGLAVSNWDALRWLALNRLPEDTDVILKALSTVPLKRDEASMEHIHSIGLDLLDVFGLKAPDVEHAMVWLWSATPCSACRTYTLDRLQTARCVPGWLLEEAAWDCNQEVREMLASEDEE